MVPLQSKCCRVLSLSTNKGFGRVGNGVAAGAGVAACCAEAAACSHSRNLWSPGKEVRQCWDLCLKQQHHVSSLKLEANWRMLLVGDSCFCCTWSGCFNCFVPNCAREFRHQQAPERETVVGPAYNLSRLQEVKPANQQPQQKKDARGTVCRASSAAEAVVSMRSSAMIGLRVSS